MSTNEKSRSGVAVWALWVPGLLVAVGAIAATAHGLFEVAVAAKVPAVIAWIYPLITDGLALVAYAATARLVGSARRYAWSVVVLAAGLSGLAQAVFLAGAVATAPPLLRFGVGAWPAVAAAIVAHLLFLLAVDHDAVQPSTAQPAGPVQPEPVQPATVHRDAVQPMPVQREALNAGVQPDRPTVTPEPSKAVQSEAPVEPAARAGEPERSTIELPSPAKDKARNAARRFAALHGDLPTVSKLQELAQVSRGTAGTALQELREQPAQLHVVDDSTISRTQP